MSKRAMARRFSRGSARELRLRWNAVAALAVIGASACGKSGNTIVLPELPGSITLTTVTSGFMKDDSYTLLVNGESQGTIGANDALTIEDLDEATYEVALDDVAANCTVDAVSVDVVGGETADVALEVVCDPPAAAPYTLRFNRARPDLDTGAITECPFGLCPTEQGWDLYVYYSSGSTPHSVIRQNQTTVVEIAHLAGVSLESLTEADYDGATFTTDLVADQFDAGRVILIRTDLGRVYALGNPVEDDTAQTLTFDAVLIQEP